MAGDVSSSREGTTISQINVTPLVDVMLVLLVIFMVTAPIIQQGFRSICRRPSRARFPAPKNTWL